MSENTKILTESGNNEVEMLIFILRDCHYAVNVSKVREIIKYMNITPVPSGDNSIAGFIMPRDVLITAIDMRYCLYGETSTPNDKAYLIICHFNKLDIAFQVDGVIGIQRISWNDITSPSEVLQTDDSSITGIVKIKDDIISIIDLEKIMTDINPSNGLTMDDVKNISSEFIEDVKRRKLTLLLVEDSKTLSKLISTYIEQVGYKVIVTSDGEEGYNKLVHMRKEGTIKDIDCIISDIEMPRMDGLTLCKKLKEDNEFRNIPFIMFSSLAEGQMADKCFSVGADDCLAKPELGVLLDKVHKLTDKED